MEQVTPSQLDTVAGIRRIDVREPHEFNGPLGHLPGAELVPLGVVPLRCAEWNPEEPVLLICRSGGRSGQAAAFLKSRGFVRPIPLAGGMLAVEQAGLPVEGKNG
jgi:rhodanese-related sulfurtransferase